MIDGSVRELCALTELPGMVLLCCDMHSTGIPSICPDCPGQLGKQCLVEQVCDWADIDAAALAADVNEDFRR